MSGIKFCGTTNSGDATKIAELYARYKATGIIFYMGMILYEPSPRNVTLQQAREISRSVEGTGIKKVIVTVNLDYDNVMRAIDYVRPDVLQLHGNIENIGKRRRKIEDLIRETTENPEYCGRFHGIVEVWKAFLMESRRILKCVPSYCNSIDYPLLDAYVKDKKGGTGHTFNWHLLEGSNLEKAIVVAGGLTPPNVGEAIRTVNSYVRIHAVDVSSGVEDETTKDKRGRERKKDHKKMEMFCNNTIATYRELGLI